MSVLRSGQSSVWHAERRVRAVTARCARLPTLVLVACLLCAPPATLSASPVIVEVTDAFLELHTGPGRGYPVFHIAERGERIELHARRTDWFRVETRGGHVGWAPRAQLERTLTTAGTPQRFRDVVVDDYLARRVETGFGVGRFDGDPVVTVRVGYRLAETVAVELSAGQVAGTFSGSGIYQAGLVFTPFIDRRIAPFVTLGAGRFTNRDRPSLVGGDERISATAAGAGAGVRGYLTRNFVVRADYRHYLSLTELEGNDTFNEWTLGLSFFF